MGTNLIQEKTFRFSVTIIKLYKTLINNKEYVLSKQLFRSGTSIGANVEEALGSSSKRDFIAKLTISRKECRETRYWLRLLKETEIGGHLNVESELNEVEQILRILYSIIRTSQSKL
jgi:four helix bundle protein